MNKYIVLTYFLVTTVFSGCEKDKNIDFSLNPSLTFQVEQSNSSRDYIANAEKILKTTRESHWLYLSDKVMLVKEIRFDLLLSNGDTVAFGFWLINYDKPEFLILEAGSVDYMGIDWDYKDFAIESGNFYNSFTEARVIINNNAIFHRNTNTNFQIIKVDEILTKGKKKSYIEISFGGTAYGFYDPFGEYQEVYKITNGYFKGIME